MGRENKRNRARIPAGAVGQVASLLQVSERGSARSLCGVNGSNGSKGVEQVNECMVALARSVWTGGERVGAA